MRTLLRFAVLAGAGLLGLLFAAGCGGGGGRRIIILTNGNSPFWDAARAGLQEADKDLKLKDTGLQAVLEVNDATPQGQIDKLRLFAGQTDIVAVGVSVLDATNEAIADQMRELQKKGIKVVTIDSDVDRDKMRDARFAFIGTDNLQGGRELGKCAKGLRPEGGEYVTFVGRLAAQNAKERIEGFAEGAGDKFKDDDNMADDTDHIRARENVRTAMSNHPNLKFLVGIWSYNAPAITDVVSQKGVRDKYTIVTFDAEPIAVDEMGKGNIDAMVVQNPYEMGYQGVRLMKALVENDEATIKQMLPHHGEKDGDIYDTGLKVVVPDEGSPLKADMFDKKVTFLKLSDFRKWLEKYKLTGS
jgi:ribose transport system substrate-binding protein